MSDPNKASGSSPTPDFSVENHVTIFLLRPLTPAAESWIHEHIPEDAQYFGNAVVEEARCFWPILEALQAEGYTVVPR